ncbi:MAG: porin family protein [Pararhodobacter sp.]|nr:porin family protein [Pararhodobacter sp.]
MQDNTGGRCKRPVGCGARLAATALIAALLPVAGAVPAMAGSFTVVPVEPAPRTPHRPTAPRHDRWDGHYAGITLGYGFHGRDEVGLNPPEPPEAIGTLRVRGAMLGAQIGANWQRGDTVFGVEGGLNWARIRDSFVNDDDQEASMRINPVGEVRGRFGFAQNDTLFYATGGLSAGRIRYSVEDPNSVPPADISSTYTALGFNVGLGVEHAIDHDWSLRGEYSYTTFRGRDLSDGTYTTRATPNFHSVRFGINRSF